MVYGAGKNDISLFFNVLRRKNLEKLTWINAAHVSKKFNIFTRLHFLY